MVSLMLIGTAHVIDLSSPLEGFLREFDPNIVALELDRNRWLALQSNTQTSGGPFFLRILSRIQKHLGESFGSSPGSEMLVAADVAKSLNAGIKLITIHGRTRCQMFRGKSDWKFIKNVKKAVKIPVVVNGDITNMSDLKMALSLSCADGVMIGRGSYGRPWIFKEISESFSKNYKYKILTSFKKDIILEHFSNSLNHYGEEVGIKSFRKHLGWYSKSLENSNEFRCKINNCLDKSQINSLIKDFF